MTTRSYKTKTGATQYRPVMDATEYMHADNQGFCLACGEEVSGIEPDVRRGTCESCGAPKVYGLEELLVMDLLVITGEI